VGVDIDAKKNEDDAVLMIRRMRKELKENEMKRE
jgi:hypothetical protein